MHRGLNDSIFYAKRQMDSPTDLICQLRIVAEKDDTSFIKKEQVPAPSNMDGNIISFELDPHNIDNVENHEQDNCDFNEFRDNSDKLVIVDGNLFLFIIDVDGNVLKEYDLKQLS